MTTLEPGSRDKLIKLVQPLSSCATAEAAALEAWDLNEKRVEDERREEG
jgi:hypothetical protein